MTITLFENSIASKNRTVNSHKPPYSLQKFQLEFGDYLRSQSASDTIPHKVGKIYQDLIFNNVSSFLNQCFPICRAILGDNFKTLSLYFFQRYPTHSPYFSEIPMQFVDFLSKLNDDNDSDWHNAITLQKSDADFVPDYLPELAHYEWLELYVDTLPDTTPKVIIDSNNSYALNHSVQNHHYHYPVHTISVDNSDIEPSDAFLVVLKDNNDKIEFIQINALTHLLIDFMQNSEQTYSSNEQLVRDFGQSIDYDNIDELLAYTDDLFALLVSQSVLIQMT